MPPAVSIKELHAKMGEIVRRVGASRAPLIVTDRGKSVAILASPDAFPTSDRKGV